MDRRWAILVVVGALALAVVLGLALAPDTGPDAVPVVTAARDAADPSPAPAGPDRPERPDGQLPVLPEGIRLPAAPPPVDPDQVHPADSDGLASATIARRARLVDCWSSFVERDPQGATGRFTVRLTVGPEAGQVEAQVPNAPDDPELAACVDDALADARFEAPDQGSVTLLVPIPLAGFAER